MMAQLQGFDVLCDAPGKKLRQKVKPQCQVSDDEGCGYLQKRSMTHISTLVCSQKKKKIKVNKSPPLIFPIIHADAEYHIERCAPVFKISFKRKWPWLALQPACSH